MWVLAPLGLVTLVTEAVLAADLIAASKFHTRVTSPKGAKTIIFSRFFQAANLNFPSFFAGARAWAGGPGPGLGRGLRRRMENVFFFKRVFEPLTLLLQDQWASLSLPADPGRLFPPVWRPQYIFP